ncbi:MAG: GNAT family N-acetyltransferase [Chitinophagaceae bacterium]
MKDTVLYLQNHEIDKLKWDQCIEDAPNGLIYASSSYLDYICGTWDAVVINDYEAVMPLPWRKKFGIQYLYQPPFIQQLGLVFKEERFKNFLHQALDVVIDKIKFGDHPFNFNNDAGKFHVRQNFILNLSHDYENLSSHYSNNLKRNLNQPGKHNLQLSSSDDIENAIELFIDLYASRIKHITKKDYRQLKHLCNILLKEDKLIIREAIDEQGNILAANLCVKDSKRLYLILPSTTPAGRKKEASHFLLDQMIKEYAGNNMIFDFEGSDIPGIAYFYQGFGAINQPYYFYHWNQLPYPARLIKEGIDKIRS